MIKGETNKYEAVAITGVMLGLCFLFLVASCSRREHRNPLDPANPGLYTPTRSPTETPLPGTATFTYTYSLTTNTPLFTDTFTQTFSETNTWTEPPTYTWTDTPTHTATETPVPDRPVAYCSDELTTMKVIMKMNADGSIRTQLTADGAPMYMDQNPSWASDGTERIAFQTGRDSLNKEEIYIMNSDGTGQMVIGSHSLKDEQPEWEPYGTRIVFQSERDLEWVPGIYTMNDDGSGVTMVTDTTNADTSPSWSPDGQWIVFISARAGGNEVYKVKPDGSMLTQLTDLNKPCTYPSWSPDGTKIIFATTLNGDNPTDYNIFTMDASPAAPPITLLADLTQLTWHILRDQCPVYSAGGDFIFWYTDRLGPNNIYRMKENGSSKIPLMALVSSEACPAYRW